MNIYDKLGNEVPQHMREIALQHWKEYYIDDAQGQEATRSDVLASVAGELEASLGSVQDFIDADPKLVDCQITTTPDPISPHYVIVHFNAGILAEPSERGMGCRGALGMITVIGAGTEKREAVGPTGFRATIDQAKGHLAVLSQMLPSVV